MASGPGSARSPSSWSRNATAPRRPRRLARATGSVFATQGTRSPGRSATRCARPGWATGCCCACRSDCDERHVGLMLEAAQTARPSPRPAGSWSCSDRRGAAGLAKTLHLEAPRIATCVDHPAAASGRCPAAAVRTAAAAIVGRRRRDHGLQRGPLRRGRHPPGTGAAADRRCGRPGRARRRLAPATSCWSPAAARASPPSARSPSAADTGAAVGLLGRSDPADRRRAGRQPGPDGRRPASRYCYARADVTSPGRGQGGGRAQITAALGPVTAVLHGAGRNEPQAARPAWTRRRSCGRWHRRSPAWTRCSPRVDPASCGCWSPSAASSAGPGCAGRPTTPPPTTG